MGLLCSLFVLQSIRHDNHIIRKKALLFSKFKMGNWERGWCQVTFLNIETPANQFQSEGGIAEVIRHFANGILG